ncbi:MAG: hypothetical protein JNK05_28220 [Myxococcales bacterium]|nr:hypothetical protein [Myxococcales bacterium]
MNRRPLFVCASIVGAGWLAEAPAFANGHHTVRCTSLVPPWLQSDSDRDGVLDHIEDTNGNGAIDQGETNAQHADSDRDGLADGVEDRNRNGRVDEGETDPRRADTDGDRIPDGVEDHNRNGRWDPGETSPTARCTGGRCRVLEDVDRTHRGPRVPEPMVTDLVRNLGAAQGELEANVLFVAPTRAPYAAHWAPEVEIAFWDGWALELELPMYATHVESFKLGLQATLGVTRDQRFAHGLQWLTDVRSDGSRVDNTLYWVGALRFSQRFSAMLLAGARLDVSTRDGATTARAMANPTLYYEPSRSLSIGVESRFWLASSGTFGLDVVPQVRWRPIDPLTIQLGAGPLYENQTLASLVACRVAIEH